jgi:hypothetical protein
MTRRVLMGGGDHDRASQNPSRSWFYTRIGLGARGDEKKRAELTGP